MEIQHARSIRRHTTRAGGLLEITPDAEFFCARYEAVPVGSAVAKQGSFMDVDPIAGRFRTDITSFSLSIQKKSRDR